MKKNRLVSIFLALAVLSIGAAAPRKPFAVVGDMWFDETRFKMRSSPEGSKLVNVGIIDKSYRWPKNTTGFVNVPYVYSSYFSASHKTTIRSGMLLIESKTCIRFIPKKSTDQDYILFIDDDGCYSYMGKLGGMQEISLARLGCVYSDIVAHELIHALGMDHMHSSFDRDNYLTVYLGNVSYYDRSQFDKTNSNYFSYFGTSFDFKSIMHYDRKAFSVNGRDTMLPKPQYMAYADSMGKNLRLSTGDVTRINAMYGCIMR